MLKAFHLVFITVSTLLAVGMCVWAIAHGQPVLGVLSVVTGGVLVFYQTRFLRKAREIGF